MRFVTVAIITVLVSFPTQAQDAVQARHSRYMERAVVRHTADLVTITANSPRPLAQAITALSEEYGWVIDFEDPPYYSTHDLVDDTDSKWRAAHPTAKGVTVVAGDGFQSQFPETAEEARILDIVVSDYNAGTNPGKFSVRDEGNGRFAVVGTDVKNETGQDQAITPILDTSISIQEETRDAYRTIEIISNAVTAKRQTKVSLGMVAQNALFQSQVTVGGQSIPARVLLQRALSAAQIKLCWHLYYDHDVQIYMLNVLPLTKTSYSGPVSQP